MPRALTEQEKCRQCQRLLEKGKTVVFSQGIRKTSVDDVARAAGIAKGSFYQHFETKEKYMYELAWHIYRQLFEQAERMLFDGDDIRVNLRKLLTNLFHMPEMIFLIHNNQEITELCTSMPSQDQQSNKKIEEAMFERLLVAAGVDIEKVKPGVVHNYIHAIYLTMGSDLMIKDEVPETCDQMMNSLTSYICGGL